MSIQYDKIGILGGSFDPIHYGHLRAAEAVRAEHRLDKIMLLPAGNPSFKQGSLGATPQQRLDMCNLAASAFPNFFVDSTEIYREGVTYTIDTLRHFKEQMPNAQLYFLLGADAMKSFHKWRNSKEILKLCALIEMPRTDEDISSTKIRDAIANVKPISGLVPRAVEDYILLHGLYNAHLQGVAEECVALGKRYGFNESELERIRKAGILHDNAKAFCETATFEEIAKICEDGNYPLDDFFYTNPAIAHCYVGAVWAKKKFHVDDEEILEAIANHTFGKPNMSIFGKIVYLTDFYDPNRPQTKERIEAKKLAYEDIDKAMIYVLKYTMEHNKQAGKAVHPLSLAALRYLEEN